MYDENVRETLATCLKQMGCNDRSSINDTVLSVTSERTFDDVTRIIDDTWAHWFEENYNNPYNETRPSILRTRVNDNKYRIKHDDSQLVEFSMIVHSFSLT